MENQTYQEFLSDYRNKYQRYKDYSDERLYDRLRASKVSAIPVWQEREELKNYYKPVEELPTISEETSPKHLNGLASMLDYGIDENSANWLKAAYVNSLTGTAEQLYTGKARYDLSDYDPSIIEDIGSSVLSFLMPLDFALTALGTRLGGGIAATSIVGLGKEGVKQTIKSRLKTAGLKAASKEGQELAAKYALRTVPMYQKAITSATTLGMYEGTFGGMQAALDPEATVGDIIKGTVGGFAHGSIMGGATGLIGGGLMGKNALFLHKAEQEAVTKLQRTLNFAITGAPTRVGLESTVFTGSQAAHQLSQEGEINVEQLTRGFITNVGMFTVLNAQNKLWNKTGEKLDKWSKRIQDKRFSEEFKKNTAAENVKEAVSKDNEILSNDTKASAAEKKASEVVFDEVSRVTGEIETKYGLEKGELSTPNAILAKWKKVKEKIDKINEKEKKGEESPKESIEVAQEYLDTYYKVQGELEAAIKELKGSEHRMSKMLIELEITEIKQIQKELSEMHGQINNVEAANNNVKNANTSQKDVQFLNLRRNELIAKLRQRIDVDKEPGLDGYLDLLEFRTSKDVNVKFDNEGKPLNQKGVIDAVEMQRRIGMVEQIVDPNAPGGMTPSGTPGVDIPHISKRAADAKSEKMTNEALSKKYGTPTIIDKHGKTIKNPDYDYRTYIDLLQTGKIKDPQKQVLKEQLLDKEVQFDKLIENVDVNTGMKMRESQDGLAHYITQHRGGIENWRGRKGYGASKAELNPDTKLRKAQVASEFAEYLAKEKGKSLWEFNSNDIQGFIQMKHKYIKNKTDLSGDIMDIVNWMDAQNFVKKPKDFKVTSDTIKFYESSADIRLGEAKGARTGIVTGKDLSKEGWFDFSKLESDGLFRIIESKTGDVSSPKDKYLIGKAREIIPELIKNAENSTKDTGPHLDFIFRDKLDKALYQELGRDILIEIFGAKSVKATPTSSPHREIRSLGRYTMEQWAKATLNPVDAALVDVVIIGHSTKGNVSLAYQVPKGERPARVKQLLEKYMEDVKRGYAIDTAGNKYGHKNSKKGEDYSLKDIKDGLEKIEGKYKDGIAVRDVNISKETLDGLIHFTIQTGGRINEILPTQDQLKKFVGPYDKGGYGRADAEGKAIDKVDYMLEGQGSERLMSVEDKYRYIKFLKQKYPEIDVKFRKELGDLDGRDILGRIYKGGMDIAEGKAPRDIIPHEISHNIINSLEILGDARSKRLIKDGLDIFSKEVKPEQAYKDFVAKRGNEVGISKVGEMTKAHKERALYEAKKEKLVDAVGKYSEKQILDKTIGGRLKAWVKNWWLNILDTFGLNTYKDAQQAKRDIVFLLGENVVKGKKPRGYAGYIQKSKVEYKFAHEASKKEFNDINAKIHVEEKRIKQEFGIDKEVIRQLPITSGGLGMKTFSKDSSIQMRTLQNYHDTLIAMQSYKQKNKNMSAEEAFNRSKIDAIDSKYNVPEIERNNLLKSLGTDVKNASPIQIKTYKSYIELNYDPVKPKATNLDWAVELSTGANAPSLSWKQRLMIPVGYLLAKHGGNPGEKLSQAMYDYDFLKTDYRGFGESKIRNIDEALRDGGMKKNLNEAYILDRVRAESALKTAKGKELFIKALGEKAYKKELKEYEKMYGKDKDMSYQDARVEWNLLSNSHWNTLKELVLQHNPGREGQLIVEKLNSLYVSGYFHRRVTKKVAQNITSDHNAITKLVEKNIETAARWEAEKQLGLKRDGKAFNNKVQELINDVDFTNKTRLKIYDMLAYGPTKVEPGFLKERGMLLPEFIEITNKKGYKELVRTYETNLDRTAGAYNAGMAKFLATLQVFPEFTQLGGKYSLGLEKKIEVFKSIEEGGNLGWYAKAAIEAELGIGERRRIAFGHEPATLMASLANTSAAIGLSSPLSGVKNYAIQVPKGFGNWGVINTVSAMAKAGWHPWRRGTKSQRELYYEGIEKGYVGYGTPEMMATESPTAIRWWFDKVNQMNRTENFNRIVQAEAGTMFFKQLLSKYKGEKNGFILPKTKEIKRLFSETYKLNSKDLAYLDGKIDFNSTQFQGILRKVGHHSHASAAGATGTAYLPLWMQGKYTKPLTLFQRIAASVTWDSYINYIKPMGHGNFAPVIKNAIGHGLAGASLYALYDWLFDVQPPKADSSLVDRMGMYVWRGEFFGVFGEVYGGAVGLSNTEDTIIPIMEPVVYRNLKTAGEEFFSVYHGTKSWDKGLADLTRRSVVVMSQFEKLVKNNMNTPGLNYNFELKRKRINTLEREWRNYMTSNTGKDFSESSSTTQSKRQFYYRRLKDAFYSGDEEAIAKEYFKAFNYIAHEEENGGLVDIQERIKYAENAINRSIGSINPLDMSQDVDGRIISRRDEFLTYLSKDNKKLALELERDFALMLNRFEKIRKSTKYRNQYSIYPYNITYEPLTSEGKKQKRYITDQQRLVMKLYGTPYNF